MLEYSYATVHPETLLELCSEASMFSTPESTGFGPRDL